MTTSPHDILKNFNAETIYEELDLRGRNYDEWIEFHKSGNTSRKSDSVFNVDLHLVSSNDLFNAGQAQSLLFGVDNRREVINSCIVNGDTYLEFSKGVAGVIKTSKLAFNYDRNSYYLKKEPFNLRTRMEIRGLRLMDRAPFLLQPSITKGTAFLVSNDLVITAKHLIPEKRSDSSANELSFIFNYRYDQSHNVAYRHFRKSDVYQGLRIVGSSSDSGGDWIIIQLDRKVSANQKPLTLNMDFSYRGGCDVNALGHPLGLPMKFTDGAKILTDIDSDYFSTSLDTYWGNSGSPVIAKSESGLGVIGLMSSTSGRYVPYSDKCKIYRPMQFYARPYLDMRCQKINSSLIQSLN